MQSSDIFFIRDDKIHIRATFEGVRYRFSTRMKATESNLKWIRKNAFSVLLKHIDNKSEKKSKIDVESFGYEVLKLTSRKRGQFTQDDYISLFERYIVPRFGAFSLDELKVFDVEHFQDYLINDLGLSTSRNDRILTILSMILDKGVANDLVNKNVVRYVDRVKVTHKKQRVFTIQEVDKILLNAKGFLKVFLSLAFSSGMRPGELLALKWDDIDFNRGVVYLQRSMNKGIITYTSFQKNHERVIILPKFVLALLRDFSLTAKCEWVFPTTKRNAPFTETKGIVKTYYKPLLQKLNIPYREIKCTRHTYVSIMRNSGVNGEYVSEFVGNSKEVQDRHYYNPIVNTEKQNAVNNVFGRFDSTILDTKLAR